MVIFFKFKHIDNKIAKFTIHGKLEYAGSHVTVQLSATHPKVESPARIQPREKPIVANTSGNQSSTQVHWYLRTNLG